MCMCMSVCVCVRERERERVRDLRDFVIQCAFCVAETKRKCKVNTGWKEKQVSCHIHTYQTPAYGKSMRIGVVACVSDHLAYVLA